MLDYQETVDGCLCCVHLCSICIVLVCERVREKKRARQRESPPPALVYCTVSVSSVSLYFSCCICICMSSCVCLWGKYAGDFRETISTKRRAEKKVKTTSQGFSTILCLRIYKKLQYLLPHNRFIIIRFSFTSLVSSSLCCSILNLLSAELLAIAVPLAQQRQHVTRKVNNLNESPRSALPWGNRK